MKWIVLADETIVVRHDAQPRVLSGPRSNHLPALRKENVRNFIVTRDRKYVNILCISREVAINTTQTASHASYSTQ